MSDSIPVVKKSYSPFNLLSCELIKRGYTVEFLPLSKKYVTVTAPNGWKWVTRWAALSYPFVSVAAKQISINKTLAYEFAEYAGVTIPQTMYLPEESSKMAEFLARYAPVIVKPAAGSGSHGLTLNVTDIDALNTAVAYAQTYSPGVVVQQQFYGEEVRVTIAEGEVVSTIWRQTAQVIGDGTSTVAELIRIENEARKELQFEQIPYPMLTEALIPAEFMTDQRVPELGEIVELSRNSLTSGGASLYEITPDIHPSYLEASLKLAEALNPEFLVVDLMIKDFTVPMTPDGYIFMEFNTAPSLRMYYGMRTGKFVDMPAKIVEMLNARSKA